MDGVARPYAVFEFGLAARALRDASSKLPLAVLLYRFQQLLGLAAYFGFQNDTLGDVTKCVERIVARVVAYGLTPDLVVALGREGAEIDPADKNGYTNAITAAVAKVRPTDDDIKLVTQFAYLEKHDYEAFVNVVKILAKRTTREPPPHRDEDYARLQTLKTTREPSRREALRTCVAFLVGLYVGLLDYGMPSERIEQTLVRRCRLLFLDFLALDERRLL